MQNKEKQAVLFCNTIWFALNFKYEICEKLLFNYQNLIVVYLRKGPPYSLHKKKEIEKQGCKFLHFNEYIIYRISNFFGNSKKTILLTFTVGPIILGSIPILFNQSKKIVVLEGLGRIFSSKYPIYKFINFFIVCFYKIIFRIVYQKIIVLNYEDFSYFLEEAICPLNKLNIIPGTGIDKTVFNIENLENFKANSKKEKSWIAYIGRIDKDKGFYRYITSVINLIKNKSLSEYKFVIICPDDDIKKLPYGFVNELRKKEIYLYPYVPDILIYYAYIKILVIPSVYAEGLSRVALEAALLGIPVVGTYNKGIYPVVKDNYSGILLKNSNPHEIAFSIEEIVKNYDFFVENCKKNSVAISNKFGVEISVKALFDIIID